MRKYLIALSIFFLLFEKAYALYDTWTPRDSDRLWSSISCSSDGTKCVATVTSGNIYTSTDSGITWTERDSSRDWRSVSCSSDGTKCVATVNGGNIYKSTDSGITWTAKDSSRNWRQVSCSSDINYCVAGVIGNGKLYVSSDFGETWVQQSPPDGGNDSWMATAINSDGSKMLGVAPDWNTSRKRCISTNFGSSWTCNSLTLGGPRLGASMSSDGVHIAIPTGGGLEISNDGGSSWFTVSSPTSDQNFVAMNGDGSVMITGGNSKIQVSEDYGVTWEEKDSIRSWVAGFVNSVGTKAFAVVSGGKIYTTTGTFESCFDGIQNQDETGIDVGGICGPYNFPYTGTGAPEGTTCGTQSYTDTSSVTWYSSTFGNLTPTPWTGSGQGDGRIGFQDTANGGLDTDYFRGIYFAEGSSLPHDVMTWGNTGAVANVEYFEDRVSALSFNDPRVRIASKRGGIFRSFNVVEVTGTGSNPATRAEFGSVTEQGFTLFNEPFRSCVSTSSTSCVITLNGQLAQFVDLHISSGFSGVRFGQSSTTTNKTSCQNDSYSCQWTYGSGSFNCSGVSFDSQNKLVLGSCEITGEGYCAPVKKFRFPNVNEHYVYDGSGNTVGINPGAYPGAPSDNYKSITDDIFSCPTYVDWTDSPKCAIDIIKKMFRVVKEGVLSTTNSSNQTIVGSVRNIGSTGSQMTFGQTTATGANMADNIFRGSWNKAFDNTDTMTGFARFALIGSFLLVIVAIALAILAINKGK